MIKNPWPHPAMDISHSVVNGEVWDGIKQSDGSVNWQPTGAYGSVVDFAAHLAAELDECKAAAYQDEKELRDQLTERDAELKKARADNAVLAKGLAENFDGILDKARDQIVALKAELAEAREEGAALARTIDGVVEDINGRDAEIARLTAELEAVGKPNTLEALREQSELNRQLKAELAEATKLADLRLDRNLDIEVQLDQPHSALLAKRDAEITRLKAELAEARGKLQRDRTEIDRLEDRVIGIGAL